MVKFQEDVFPLNSLAKDIEGRGTYPLVVQWFEVTPGALTAGEATVDVKSVFGKGSGTPKFVSFVGAGAKGDMLGATVAPHATDDGKLTITIFSSDDTSTTDFGTFTIGVVGQIGI